MPARNPSSFPFPEPDPDENIVPSELADDEALWMLLNSYADGESSDEEIVRVESLLRANPGIAREFSFLKFTSDSVREFGEIDPPDTLVSAIFAATVRRKTVLQRVQGWWAQNRTSFGPAPLRFAGAALASGFLAIVLWSRFGGIQRPYHLTAPPAIAMRQNPHAPVISPIVIPEAPHNTTPHRNDGFVRFGPDIRSVTPLASVGADGQAARLQEAVVKSMVVRQKPATPVVGASDGRRGNPRMAVTPDVATSGVVVAHANVEQRHMSSVTDTTPKTAKPDDLGPDVDTTTDAHADEVASAMPPATYDEPPTAVSTVSYLPGSISDKTRNAPPEVQSLYMRTQSAIRHQHEIQQYGGYGKDTYNSIQRHEVGLSLVGGRF